MNEVATIDPSKVENAGGSDQEILDKARVTITLAGREYEWEEPTEKEKRDWTREIMKLQAIVTSGNPDSFIEYAEGALNFFFRHHGRMANDKKHLLNNASTVEIMEAYRVIEQFVSGDFLAYLRKRGQEHLAAQEAEENASKNGRST